MLLKLVSSRCPSKQFPTIFFTSSSSLPSSRSINREILTKKVIIKSYHMEMEGASISISTSTSASPNQKPNEDEKREEGISYTNISLRPIEISDLDDFMVWASDDRATHFCSWDSYTSREAALDYIKETAIPHPWYRVICLEKRPVGAISVIPGSGNDNCRGELGYMIASKYWGRGIVTRAVKLVVSSIFKEWPHLVRLEALVDVVNPGSQRVLEKVGFQKEGVLRRYLIQKGRILDMVMYSLLSTDPKLVN